MALTANERSNTLMLGYLVCRVTAMSRLLCEVKGPTCIYSIV